MYLKNKKDGCRPSLKDHEVKNLKNNYINKIFSISIKYSILKLSYFICVKFAKKLNVGINYTDIRILFLTCYFF